MARAIESLDPTHAETALHTLPILVKRPVSLEAATRSAGSGYVERVEYDSNGIMRIAREKQRPSDEERAAGGTSGPRFRGASDRDVSRPVEFPDNRSTFGSPLQEWRRVNRAAAEKTRGPEESPRSAGP